MFLQQSHGGQLQFMAILELFEELKQLVALQICLSLDFEAESLTKCR